MKAQRNRTEQTRLPECDPPKKGNQQEQTMVRLWSNNCVFRAIRTELPKGQRSAGKCPFRQLLCNGISERGM
jgi:hypothetical protein